MDGKGRRGVRVAERRLEEALVGDAELGEVRLEKKLKRCGGGGARRGGCGEGRGGGERCRELCVLEKKQMRACESGGGEGERSCARSLVFHDR